MSIRKYGWKPDIPDKRDFKFEFTTLQTLPSSIDMEEFFPPVYDQGNLGSCHDDRTQVLTKSGWKLFSELYEGEELASVCPETSKLIFEKPSRLIKIPFNGDLYYCEHQHINFAVTPDHQMLIRKWNETNRTLNEKYELVSMKDIGWYAGLMSTVKYSGYGINQDWITLKGVECNRKEQENDIQIEMKKWLHFLGIYLAEGTMIKSKIVPRILATGTISSTERDANKIQIAASKAREKAFVRETLKNLNVNFLELKDRFTFRNKRIFKALEFLGLRGIKAHQKFVPDFVFRLNAENIKSFLYGHFMGDGCVQHGLRSHYTSSSKLAEDLQRLVFLSGDTGNLCIRPARNSITKNGKIIKGQYPEHRISVRTSNNQSINRKKDVILKPYNGFVYCAEMPTYHTMVTRRERKILISGNCTSQAIAAAVQYQQNIDKPAWAFMPSRLFIYFNERILENTVNEDSGAMIRTGIKVINKIGTAKEDLWPYDIAKFTYKPPLLAYQNAKLHTCLRYQRVGQTEFEIKTALAQGHPVIFGFSVYESFETDIVAHTGIVPLPLSFEKLLGGHAVLIVGYDDEMKLFKIRNSYGPNWGRNGYFYLPYEYVCDSDLSCDFWIIEQMSN